MADFFFSPDKINKFGLGVITAEQYSDWSCAYK